MAALSYSSSKSISSSYQALNYRLLLLLTLLPLTVAFFAFILQWQGGLIDPLLSSPDSFQFPGMDYPGSNSRPHRRSVSDCVDVLGQSRSPAFPYFKDWNFEFGSNLRPKICIVSSTAAGLEQILPWIFFHKVIGVSTFFLFVEGKAASPVVSRVLESIPVEYKSAGVEVIYRTKELEERQAKSRIWNETWLAKFFYKPCNHELFVKQTLNMEMAIVMSRDAGMDWIIHLDTDELIHPSSAREYSVRQLLADLPEDVDMESCVERDDIIEPFTEVSMFKKNFDHLPIEAYLGNYRRAIRGNPNYFLTYGNGKAAARIQDHLRPHGAHRWHNYMKAPKEIKLDEAAVLHYTYTKFSDLTSRRDRCGCKPTKEDVKKCFMLEFDRAAFIIASTATEEEMLRWYRHHVVWTNKALSLKLLKRGILTRIYTPMAIIQGLRESGVFGSVLQSAQTLSKDKFLSSVEGSNFSSVHKQIGVKESQATARRILDINDNFSGGSAIPPLSPPVPDDFHIGIS
ncbi:hypothetical protein CXB51_002286 [Gossypium anomalum]|uniref:Glycosyltransferase family 92 protein n=1 Tax=Gossypium anomalum TaxID=47600 RepID=A0A8J5Z6P9_9ROSI|nr:hypothetical protein CXB51_002286 [Gossypium anomalum]